jgi:hypothetical protein
MSTSAGSNDDESNDPGDCDVPVVVAGKRGNAEIWNANHSLLMKVTDFLGSDEIDEDSDIEFDINENYVDNDVV